MPVPLSSLRNKASFRHFDDIDDDILLNPNARFWEIRDHTAFVGQITDVVPFGRTVLLVRDPAGKTITIAFYDSTRGRDIISKGCKIGDTVLLLYPQRYQFLDGQIGFRIEDEQVKNIKIFPFTYDQMLKANDVYFQLINKQSECHANSACSTKKTTADGPSTTSDGQKPKLLRCARCNVAKYCSKECQAAHWKAGGHKDVCKALASVQWITKKKWGDIWYDDDDIDNVELYDTRD